MSDKTPKSDPSKKPKRPRDANQLAKYIVDLATGQTEEENEAGAKPTGSKGSAGGKSRAEKMTPKQRSDIAKKAAAKRWGTDS